MSIRRTIRTLKSLQEITINLNGQPSQPSLARPLPYWWSRVVGARGWASCCGRGCLAPALR